MYKMMAFILFISSIFYSELNVYYDKRGSSKISNGVLASSCHKWHAFVSIQAIKYMNSVEVKFSSDTECKYQTYIVVLFSNVTECTENGEKTVIERTTIQKYRLEFHDLAPSCYCAMIAPVLSRYHRHYATPVYSPKICILNDSISAAVQPPDWPVEKTLQSDFSYVLGGLVVILFVALFCIIQMKKIEYKHVDVDAMPLPNTRQQYSSDNENFFELIPTSEYNNKIVVIIYAWRQRKLFKNVVYAFADFLKKSWSLEVRLADSHLVGVHISDDHYEEMLHYHCARTPFKCTCSKKVEDKIFLIVESEASVSLEGAQIKEKVDHKDDEIFITCYNKLTHEDKYLKDHCHILLVRFDFSEKECRFRNFPEKHRFIIPNLEDLKLLYDYLTSEIDSNKFNVPGNIPLLGKDLNDEFYRTLLEKINEMKNSFVSR